MNIRLEGRKGCFVALAIGIILYFVALIIVILSFTPLAERGSKYPRGGRDTIERLGDERFQIGKLYYGRDLSDYAGIEGTTLVTDIEKYVIKNPYIYVIGYYANGFRQYLDPKDGKLYYYYEDSEIPRYLILNYETAELRTYVDWEDVPLDDKAIFNTPLKECRQWKKIKNCWEKSLLEKKL